ncbi:MAG: alpha-1,2-fucosyltransferase [Blautia sp.]|nr:alpha-1,2-fucosyltransferase [Blautia sp.]MCM1200915.1 alpha-1,2-fucosyltransferase [Bacteroides fragilis]
MIIIQMAGGLGNQMFQYALYRQLISMGRTVKMDDEAGFREDAQRNPALAAFGIVYEKASRQEIIEMTDSSMAFSARVRRKLFGRKSRSYFEESKRFQSQIFDWDNVYLEGYWQSEKYFADVAELLKKEFSLESIRKNRGAGYGLSPQAESCLRRIEREESVSIHVRRGDYLLPQNQELFGNICTERYYEKAVKTVMERYPGCTFYLFTNDREWAAEELKKHGGFPIVPVELPGGKDYETLALMSRCKHNILANSSFSWWASYLNDYPDRLVLAPEKWLNGWDCTDIYRTDMVRVGAEI